MTGFVSSDPLDNLTNLYQRPQFIPNAGRAPTTQDLQPAGTEWQFGQGASGAIYISQGSGVWAEIATSGGGDVTGLTGDSGAGAVPTAGKIKISGGTTGLTTVAAASAVTLGGTLKVANGGTGATTLTGVLTGNGTSAVTANAVTQHGILLGGASNAVSSLGVASNGQIPIGSVGADPVLATITPGLNIVVTNGAGTLAISETDTPVINSYTFVAVTPYVVVPATDYYLSVDCSGGAITVQLPNAPTLYSQYIIKDRTGSSATNAITITTVGGAVNIDGAATYALNVNYKAVQVLFNGTAYEVF